jgi:hypothetical protein
MSPQIIQRSRREIPSLVTQLSRPAEGDVWPQGPHPQPGCTEDYASNWWDRCDNSRPLLLKRLLVEQCFRFVLFRRPRIVRKLEHHRLNPFLRFPLAHQRRRLRSLAQKRLIQSARLLRFHVDEPIQFPAVPQAAGGGTSSGFDPASPPCTGNGIPSSVSLPLALWTFRGRSLIVQKRSHFQMLTGAKFRNQRIHRTPMTPHAEVQPFLRY